MVCWTSRTEARMVVVRSLRTVISIDARNGGFQLRQISQHAVDGVDDVRAGLPVDAASITAGLPFTISDVAEVFDRILDAWRYRRASPRRRCGTPPPRARIPRLSATDPWC